MPGKEIEQEVTEERESMLGCRLCLLLFEKKVRSSSGWMATQLFSDRSIVLCAGKEIEQEVTEERE